MTVDKTFIHHSGNFVRLGEKFIPTERLLTLLSRGDFCRFKVKMRHNCQSQNQGGPKYLIYLVLSFKTLDTESNVAGLWSKC